MAKPDWERDGISLYLGDCLDVLPTLAAGSVDAVVTDPPYGVGKEYGGKREVADNAADYWRWFEPIWAECRRTLAPGGFWAVYQWFHYTRHLWQWFGAETRLYCAARNFVPMSRTAINWGYDPVAIGYKNGATPRRPKRPKRNLDFFVANMAGIISDPTRLERQHPTPKPVDGVQALVENFTVPTGTVLDAFMGSGTTGVACVQTGRKFIGMEIEPKYFDIAVKRIEAAIAERAEQLAFTEAS